VIIGLRCRWVESHDYRARSPHRDDISRRQRDLPRGAEQREQERHALKWPVPGAIDVSRFAPACYGCPMPIFYLEPKYEVTSDPRWSATNLREGCWIDASTEGDARQAVGVYTAMRDVRLGEKMFVSPWYDPTLTDCRHDEPSTQVPEGIIVTLSGRTISRHTLRPQGEKRPSPP